MSSRGEVLGVVGGSGHGQVGAAALHHRPQSARSRAASRCSASKPADMDAEDLQGLQLRWGVLFQGGALFSSHDRGRKHPGAAARATPHMTQELMDEIAAMKLVAGRAAAGCRAEISVRTLRRHDASAPALPGRWRSTRNCCSSTSRPPASTRFPPISSMSWCEACSRAWG